MNTQFNYIKPIKKQLETKLHKECQKFLKWNYTDKSLTPRYYNIKHIKNNTLRIGSTQDRNFYFEIDLTNVKEYNVLRHKNNNIVYSVEKFWEQFKEFRTQFLKEHYPQIDTGENDKPPTKGLFQLTKELIEDNKNLENYIDNHLHNKEYNTEDKKEVSFREVNLNLLTIREELEEYVFDGIDDYDNIKELIENNELHHELFNTDYYIIGTHKAKEWLKEHKTCVFDVCEYIKQYEVDNFGECTTDLSSPEKVVNMLVYIVGEQIIYNMEKEILETIEQ